MKVYEVEFDISGSDETYNAIIADVLSWCEERIFSHTNQIVKLRKETSFDHEIGITFESKIVDGQSWVGKYVVPQKSESRYLWTSVVSLLSTNGKIRFALTLETTAPYSTPSRPKLVPMIVSKYNCSKNDWILTGKPVEITGNTVEAFIEKLKSSQRPIPFVVVTKCFDESLLFDVDKLCNVLAGSANVYVLDKEATFRVSDTFGREWSVFNGAIRIYFPKFGDDIWQHPLYTPNYILDKGVDRILRQISRRIGEHLNFNENRRVMDVAPILAVG